jgi:hypothetical protein
MSEEKVSKSSDSELTLVICTHLADAQFVSRVLLPSMDKYLDVRGIGVMIVAPRSHHEQLREQLRSSHFTIEFIADEDVADRGDMKGYRYQMVLKLAVSRLIKTRSYMTLDSDLFFVAPTSVDCLIRAGRALVTMDYKTTHEHWHTISGHALGVEFEEVPQYVMGVTPAILITEVSKSLMETINVHAVIATGGTEYSLYWLYLIKNYDSDELYTTGGEDGFSRHTLYDGCVWSLDAESRAHDGFAKRVQRCIAGCRGYMSLVQSTAYRQLSDIDSAIDVVREQLSL